MKNAAFHVLHFALALASISGSKNPNETRFKGKIRFFAIFYLVSTGVHLDQQFRCFISNSNQVRKISIHVSLNKEGFNTLEARNFQKDKIERG